MNVAVYVSPVGKCIEEVASPPGTTEHCVRPDELRPSLSLALTSCHIRVISDVCAVGLGLYGEIGLQFRSGNRKTHITTTRISNTLALVRTINIGLLVKKHVCYR